MNQNVTNRVWHSGLIVTYAPVQFPNIPLTHPLTVVNASGSTSHVYLGNAGVNTVYGVPLAINGVRDFVIDNANLLWAVCQSGFTADLRFYGG